MYAITGVTGRVGGAAAQFLTVGGHKLRAVLRDPAKAASWTAQGAEVAIADMTDEAALAAAFAGAEGVFVMVPPYFSPEPGYPEARAVAAALVRALKEASPGRVVALSSIGSNRAEGLGLITQVRILEDALAALELPTAILRPAWFMENSAWDVAPARETGEMPSFLAPLDRSFPMVATADIGKAAAKALLQRWAGRRIIEIEGPKRYTQNDVASLLGRAVGNGVVARPVPRDQWEAVFRAQGTERPASRIDMIDGFNSGWIDFEPGHEHITGETSFETVLADLVRQAA